MSFIYYNKKLYQANKTVYMFSLDNKMLFWSMPKLIPKQDFINRYIWIILFIVFITIKLSPSPSIITLREEIMIHMRQYKFIAY